MEHAGAVVVPMHPAYDASGYTIEEDLFRHYFSNVAGSYKKKHYLHFFLIRVYLCSVKSRLLVIVSLRGLYGCIHSLGCQFCMALISLCVSLSLSIHLGRMVWYSYIVGFAFARVEFAKMCHHTSGNRASSFSSFQKKITSLSFLLR